MCHYYSHHALRRGPKHPKGVFLPWCLLLRVSKTSPDVNDQLPWKKKSAMSGLYFMLFPSFITFIHSFIRSFVRSFVHSFIHSFIHSLVCSFVRSSVLSFVSFVHSFIHSVSFFLSFFLHSECFFDDRQDPMLVLTSNTVCHHRQPVNTECYRLLVQMTIFPHSCMSWYQFF